MALLIGKLDESLTPERNCIDGAFRVHCSERGNQVRCGLWIHVRYFIFVLGLQSTRFLALLKVKTYVQ